MIQVNDLIFRYRRNSEDTIRKVSFDVKPGEIFGFLGPSGAGKSTLQKILTGVIGPYHGNVRVFGGEVAGAGTDFYERIGVDFEFPNFYGKCTAMENLTFFASLYMREKADWMALLERVGLLDSANKRVSDFSKGMKMRLAFVRALAHNPDLLFLDEPTGGLDPASARTMKNIIKEQKEQGKSIILTTHNMTDAAELCDRVAFIVDGQIKALDSPKSLQTQIPETNVDFTYRDNGTTSTSQAALAELGKNKTFMATLREGTLLSIHSREKTLEDVFIELTGRALQ